MRYFFLLLTLGFSFLLSTVRGQAGEVFTLPLPIPSSTSWPAWLQPGESNAAGAFAEASFRITPPVGAGALALTIVFNESGGGFLKVFFTGANGPTTLAENLFEGTGLPGQKTLLIPAQLLSAPGVLTLQSGSNTLPVSRLRWAWTESVSAQAEPGAATPALSTLDGRIFTAEAVSGDPAPASADFWKGEVIHAALTEKPQRIEEGIEYSAPISSIPKAARASIKIEGLPIDQTIYLWVNGKNIGPISMTVPDLADPGYAATTDGTLAYAGWRPGAILIPPTDLVAGYNSFQLILDNGTAMGPTAIKDFYVEFFYPTTTPTASASNTASTTP